MDKSANGVVQHTTILWLKQPGDPLQRQQLVEGLKRFADIPGVLAVYIGNALPLERNPANPQLVDASFDLSVTLLIASEDDYAAYIKHPIHDRMARNTIAPYIQRYVMYDAVLVP